MVERQYDLGRFGTQHIAIPFDIGEVHEERFFLDAEGQEGMADGLDLPGFARRPLHQTAQEIFFDEIVGEVKFHYKRNLIPDYPIDRVMSNS